MYREYEIHTGLQTEHGKKNAKPLINNFVVINACMLIFWIIVSISMDGASLECKIQHSSHPKTLFEHVNPLAFCKCLRHVSAAVQG